MAKITLPTNYRDDILNPSADGKRKYIMSYNQDGTVSFEDVTPYEQVGSDYGAGDINTTNEAVNESFDKNKLIKDLDTINALTEEGYAPDALAFKELNNSLGGCEFSVESDGAYVTYTIGADTIKKKLGSGGCSIVTINDANVNIYDAKTNTITLKNLNMLAGKNQGHLDYTLIEIADCDFNNINIAISGNREYIASVQVYINGQIVTNGVSTSSISISNASIQSLKIVIMASSELSIGTFLFNGTIS